MSEALNLVYKAIDLQYADKPATTRRGFVAGAAAALGGVGLASVPRVVKAAGPNDTATILTVASTAEVLATIVNTIGFRRGLGGDPVTQRNIKAAAREELIHFNVLVELGAKPATKKIWIPDAVFANRRSFLSTLEVGDDIFVNAYLVATQAFGERGQGELAISAAQFCGVEAVHRALARQSLGKLGNDRVFLPEHQKEQAPDAPNRGQPGFEDILVAVSQLQAAGFGFGERGATPGRFYDFDEVKKRTPTDPDINTFRPEVLAARHT